MKINPKTRNTRIAVAALLALRFAGSGLTTAATAMGVPVPAGAIYLSATTAVLLCALGALPRPAAALSAALFAGVAAIYVAGHLPGVRAIRALFAVWSGLEADPQNHLLMHAVGANVSGQIASVLAGGMILNLVPQLLK